MTESVKNELSDICRIIDATVDTEKIYLFGSYAYGIIFFIGTVPSDLR